MNGGFNDRAAGGGYNQAELVEGLLRLIQGQTAAAGSQQHSSSSIPAASQAQPYLLSLLQELMSQSQSFITHPTPAPCPQQHPPSTIDSSLLLVAALAASLGTADGPPATVRQTFSSPGSAATLTQDQFNSLALALLLQHSEPLQQRAPPPPPPQSSQPQLSQLALVEALASLLNAPSTQPENRDPSPRHDTVQELSTGAAVGSQQSFSQHPMAAKLLPKPPPDPNVGVAATMHNYSEPMSSCHDEGSATLRIPPSRKRRSYHHESFPEKLHRMVQQVEEAGMQDIVSFSSSGRALKISQPQKFCEVILPHYFRHKRFYSFKRQLSMYGFQRIQIGPDEGAFTHPLFVKGRPDLCRHMKRVTELLSENEGDTNVGEGHSTDDPSSPSSANGKTNAKPGLKQPPSK